MAIPKTLVQDFALCRQCRQALVALDSRHDQSDAGPGHNGGGDTMNVRKYK